MDERNADVRELWGRCVAWLEEHMPAQHGELRPPARPEAFERFTEATGIAFPDELRSVYLVNDGSESDVLGLAMLPVERIIEQWRLWTQVRESDDWSEWVDLYSSHPPDAIRREYSNAGWIPVFHDGGGNHIGGAHLIDDLRALLVTGTAG